MKLKNRIAAITGGSSGICVATTAQRIQSAGNVGNYLERNVEAVAKAGKEIGGDTVGVTADVARVADLDRALQQPGGVLLLWRLSAFRRGRRSSVHYWPSAIRA